MNIIDINIFEFATRNKFRFPYKGLITTEDLWDLTVQQLNGIYKYLKSQERQAKEESLLAAKTKDDDILAAKIEIIRYIVNVKLEEAKQAGRAKELNDQKQKLLALIEDKKNEELKAKSVDELVDMLEAMEKE